MIHSKIYESGFQKTSFLLHTWTMYRTLFFFFPRSIAIENMKKCMILTVYICNIAFFGLFISSKKKKSALLQQPLTALLLEWQLLHKLGVFCVCVICVFVCVPTSSLYKAADAACFWSCCLCLCALSHGRVADPKLESSSFGLSAKPSRPRAFVPASAIQLHSSQTHVRRHFQNKDKYFPCKYPTSQTPN
jgi:hypothetical protein